MDLFDRMAQLSGCMITDLKYSKQYRLKTETAKNVADDAFPVESWNALLSYLYDQPLQFASVAEARAYLDTPWETCE